jgi:hypothetical protein
MTPAEKLDRSRLAIIEYLERREHRGEPRADDGSPDDGDDGGDGGRHLFSGDGWLGGLSSAARAWWRHHPAQLAMEMATPALRSYMRRRPFQVLGLSAGVGALLVVTRPWRLISLTTLVVAIVKSSQLSGVVMSALAGAQGWQSQQQGREPPL